MSKKTKIKLAILSGATVLQAGVIGTCNDILSIVFDPIVFLGALDQLGFVQISGGN